MTLLRRGSEGQTLRSSDGREAGLQLDGYLPYRLSVASNAVSGLIARAYEDRFGLSVPQCGCSVVLAEDGGLTQVQIVARSDGQGHRQPRRPGLVKRRLVTLAEHPTAAPTSWR